MKDLGENMMDIKVYQENLGDELREGDLDYSAWLAEGLDSVLMVVSGKFKEHRKFKRSFSYYYQKDLKTPLQNIKISVAKEDTASAIRNYNLLIKKCNGCHIDNDIDKVVKY